MCEKNKSKRFNVFLNIHKKHKTYYKANSANADALEIAICYLL